MALETRRVSGYGRVPGCVRGRGAAGVAAHAAALVLAACAATPQGGRQPVAGPAAPVSPHGAPTDASFDWRGLVVVPFGTRLVDSPVPLHEVLLFHDVAHSSAETDNRDCYAVDGAPPRFMGRQADEYLLCFGHDRLNRIEATIRLAAADAADTFARACARWLVDSPAAPLPVPPPLAVPSPLPSSSPPSPSPSPSGNACQGREGGISWSARLADLPDAPTVALSITLAVAAESQPGAATRPAAAGAVDPLSAPR